MKIENLDKKIDALRREIKHDERALEKVLTQFLGSALALAAALFWKDAILSAIKNFLPVSQRWEWELSVAIIFTLVASSLILISTRWSHRR